MMLGTPVYSVHRLGKVKNRGATMAVSGTLKAVFKFNCEESPHCVYNELVAVRLAQTFHAPIAAGVMTVAGPGAAFASLHIGAPGVLLPDVLELQLPKIASLYPEAVAGLVAFDIFIGNDDRHRNLKVSLIHPHLALFSAFDQGSGLYGVQETLGACVGYLRWNGFNVSNHPFYGLVKRVELDRWIDRIIKTQNDQIMASCCIGAPVGLISVDDQEALGEALCARRKTFRKLIKDNLHIIRPV